MNARRVPLVALAAGALLLAGCDADGDGLDDTTGEPVAASGASDTTSSGCGPGGWELLCGGDADEPANPEPQSEESSSGGCGPGGWELLCGGDDPEGPDPDTGGCILDGGELVGDDPYNSPSLSDQEWLAVVTRHEAGHVAAARELGATSISVTIYPDGDGPDDTAGFTEATVPTDPTSLITYAAAGAIAAGTDAGAEGDYVEINNTLETVPAADCDRITDTALAKAERIVSERADQIDRDVAVLLERGRL